MKALNFSRVIAVPINFIESVADVDGIVNIFYCTTCMWGDQIIDLWIINQNSSKMDCPCSNF